MRVCGIGEIFSQLPYRDSDSTQVLVDRLLDDAARDGAAMALLFSDMRPEHRPAGFDVVSMTEAELRVTESARRGAPMTLIRGGAERDLAAIAAMDRSALTHFGFISIETSISFSTRLRETTAAASASWGASAAVLHR